MALRWKEIIRPGSYFYIDEGTGEPRKLKATPEMIQHWYRSGCDMLGAGLSVPIPLEHQKSAVPLTASQRAANQLENNAGFVKQYKMRGDRLYGQLDIENEELAQKLPRTIKYTSPWFNSFTDGDGRQWNGVITHLALTSRPRIHRQEPFQSEQAALSLAAEISSPPATGAFLSRAGLLVPGASSGSLVPAYPMAFSVWSGVKLAEDFPLEKSSKEKLPEKESKGPPEKSSKEKPAEGAEGEAGKEPLDDFSEEEEMEMVDVLRDVLSALTGIELPEGTDEKNLMQRLLKALMDHMKMENGNMPEEKDMNNQTPPAKTNNTPSPVVQEQQPVYMSLEEVNAITDPKLKQMAQAMLSMQGQTELLRKNLFDQARQRRTARIERLARGIKVPNYKENLLKQGESMAFSLDASGAVVDPMIPWLDVLETTRVEVEKDIPDLLKPQSTKLAIDEQAHPEDAGSGMSEERRKAIMAEFEANTGLVSTAPAA